jgi:hypothetical protein
MANHRHDDSYDAGLPVSPAEQPAERRSRRRKQVMVGVVGMAAILGGAGFLASETMSGGDSVIRDTGALGPVTPPSSPSRVTPRGATPSSTGPSASRRLAAPVSRTPSPRESESLSVRQRISAARSSAAKAGFPLQRPLSPASAAAEAVPPTVTTIGSLEADGATMRVVSARYDLTGQRELAWAADDGEQIGQAHCTQNFHFSNNGTARVRPTMLLCWHTSADRSVLTVAVTRSGRPSKPASVAVIDKLWAQLN